MRSARITVIDLNLSGSIGGSLCDVLRTSDGSQEWQLEAALIHQPVLDEPRLAEILASQITDLLVLILPHEPQSRSSDILRLLKLKLGIAIVVVVSEAKEPQEIFTLLQQGASEFIPLPIDRINVLPWVWRLLGNSSVEGQRRHDLRTKVGLRQMLGQSPAWTEQIRKIPLIARCDANVLISGETGTGKELCARAIHYLSLRASMPFVPVNCGAIPETLLENELFGHAKGAFTDATGAQAGLLGEADEGTLFLDEMDCLTPAAQVKLLRFIQEKEYRPLGSARACHADVRIVAATNIDLERALQSGKLRQDLYYRINVVPLSLPPLRERRDDIPLLARHFLKKHSRQLACAITNFTSDALDLLQAYSWPGNVRELEHIIERAVVLCELPLVDAHHLSLPAPLRPAQPESFQQAKARTIAEFERSYIERLLAVSNGNISQAARTARKNRRAFWQLMRKHQIRIAERRTESLGKSRIAAGG
jgi:DNA-binding NtrC family response regulator